MDLEQYFQQQLLIKYNSHSDIIEFCLAHAETNKIKVAYNRKSKMKYYEEKKELMQL